MFIGGVTLNVHMVVEGEVGKCDVVRVGLVEAEVLVDPVISHICQYKLASNTQDYSSTCDECT